MKKFKAVDAVCIMVLAGFACVVHAIGDREE